MKKIIPFFVAFLLGNVAIAASLEEDVNQYVAAVSIESTIPVSLLESFAWMGISDPRVFDVLERRISNQSERARNDKIKKNEIALCIRALGFSGQSKYTETLNKLISDRTYERYAETAMRDLGNYSKWNPVISNRMAFDSRYSDDVNRILNMLDSDDFMLKRIGAKRVYFSNKEDVLLEALVNEIRASYGKTESSPEISDAIAWMVKALGSAKNDRYQPLFQEVIEKTSDQKVRKYAERALGR